MGNLIGCEKMEDDLGFLTVCLFRINAKEDAKGDAKVAKGDAKEVAKGNAKGDSTFISQAPFNPPSHPLLHPLHTQKKIFYNNAKPPRI